MPVRMGAANASPSSSARPMARATGPGRSRAFGTVPSEWAAERPVTLAAVALESTVGRRSFAISRALSDESGAAMAQEVRNIASAWERLAVRTFVHLVNL